MGGGIRLAGHTLFRRPAKNPNSYARLVAAFLQLPYREHWPPEFWDRNLPCDYLTFPRKDERATVDLKIPDGMVATGMRYYNIDD